MSKAIGMVEYKTVSAGVVAADAMVKTSEVNIIEAQTVCPGKYIVIISGDLSAVNAAVETAKTLHEKHLINSFVLGNPHESIFPAIYGAAKIEEVSALGIMETYDATTIIVAADEAAKTAIVDLVELRVARGMCGKSYLMLTGEVAAVEAAIERAKMVAAEGGMYLDSSVIAHPDAQIREQIGRNANRNDNASPHENTGADSFFDALNLIGAHILSDKCRDRQHKAVDRQTEEVIKLIRRTESGDGR